MVQLVRHLVPTHLGACHMTSRDLTIDNVTCRIHVTARERTSHVTTFRLSLFLPGEDKGEETSSLVPRPESRLAPLHDRPVVSQRHGGRFQIRFYILHSTTPYTSSHTISATNGVATALYRGRRPLPLR